MSSTVEKHTNSGEIPQQRYCGLFYRSENLSEQNKINNSAVITVRKNQQGLHKGYQIHLLNVLSLYSRTLQHPKYNLRTIRQARQAVSTVSRGKQVEVLQLPELSQQGPGKHLESCSQLRDSQLAQTHLSLSVLLSPAGLGAGGEKSSAWRGAQDGENCRLLRKAQRALWPGRCRGQAVKVMDCRMHKPRNISCSLLPMSCCQVGSKSRRGRNEIESPDVIGAGLTKEKDW